jgi:ParB-like chromosome segregation protein Spo0J
MNTIARSGYTGGDRSGEHRGAGDRLSVTYRPLAALIPYARNARAHSDEQVAQIAASIRAFGFTSPILVDGKNGIIAGHGRLLAARKLGMGEVPVIELAGMSEAQKRAYIIADNKLALNAGWDTEMLAIEFGDLAGLGFDLSLTGFGEDELAAIMSGGNPGLTDPDEITDVCRRTGQPGWGGLAARLAPPGLRRQHQSRAGRARPCRGRSFEDIAVERTASRSAVSEPADDVGAPR